MNRWRLRLPTPYFLWSIVVTMVLAAVPFGARRVQASVEALPGASGTLWVTNTSTDNVAVFDAATGGLLALIPTGYQSKPVGVVGPSGTEKVYVSAEGNNAVVVISKRSLEVIATIPTGPKPHHIGANPNGKFVYVAEFGTNKVGVIDTDTDTLIGEWVTSESAQARTHAVNVTRDGKILLATNSVANEIAALNALTGERLWTLPVGTNPSEVLASHNGKRAYVSIRNEDMLQVIDLEEPALLDAVYVGDQPDTLQLSPNGSMVVIGLRGTPAQLATVNVGGDLSVEWVNIAGTTTGHNALSANGRYSFIAIEGGTPGVAVIDHQSQQVVDMYQYPQGGKPHGVFYEPANPTFEQ
ncbi:MAG TPA: YncE family protein [Herpetosiphonaceae bacterium]|nr:YncE family protein [Herpetosiphonaceae bacterium]